MGSGILRIVCDPMTPDLQQIQAKILAKRPVSPKEAAQLVRHFSQGLDFLELLPQTLTFQGHPMDVANRRPMFSPLFRKQREAQREISLCGRQTGKTSSAAASMLMNLIWRQHFDIMYLAPLAIYTQRLHQVHFAPFIKNCRLPWPIVDRDCVNNVNAKSFLTGSHFHAASLYNSAANAIGIKIDSLVFDECQDLNRDFIPMAQETLKNSEFRWESYFGTARTMDNTIQTLFDESSMDEWHMRCGCGLWVIPDREHHAISMIQKQGISCPQCSRLIDVTRGEWVSRHPERAKEFRGRHIPATIVKDLLLPHGRYIDTIYNKLHGVSRYSESKFLQEVLGISSDQGGRPITPAEVAAASILPISASSQTRTSNYLSLAGGADWGGAEIVSFTVGTVVGWTSEGKFHCLGATRPTGVVENERHLPLAGFFQRIGQGQLYGIGADVGFVGGVQNRNLQRAAGIKTASIGYGTKKNFYQALENNHFVVDRTTLIYIVYTLIREGKLLFPAGEWFETFSHDLTATFVEEIEAPNGARNRRYCRYSQRPDDFLHALGYAVFICALGSGIDLPALIGMTPHGSLNSRFVEVAGEEGGGSDSSALSTFEISR